MAWALRNVMTVGVLLTVLGATVADAAGTLPNGVQLAQWAIVAGALGRALVLAAEQLAEVYAPVTDEDDESDLEDDPEHAEHDGEGEG